MKAASMLQYQLLTPNTIQVFSILRNKPEGKGEADPYLIAYCKVNSFTLITNESKVKPNKIPAVEIGTHKIAV